MKKIILSFVIVFLFFPLLSFADPVENSMIQVGTIERPPFMMHNDTGKMTGFSVELWEEIAKRLNIEYQWKEFKIFGNMIDATKNNQVDASIANITITSKREKVLDYSQPIFDSGLQILVPKKNENADFKNFLRQKDVKWYLLGLFIISIIVFYILWYKFSKKIAIFWGLFIMISMIFFILQIFDSFVIRDIDSVERLGGRNVGSMKTPTVRDYLNEKGISPQEFLVKEDLYQALKTGKVDAIVDDAPISQYYATHQGSKDVKISGGMFKKERYGIIFPTGSGLREKVNIVLLQIEEDGTYKKIYNKYFKTKN